MAELYQRIHEQVEADGGRFSGSDVSVMSSAVEAGDSIPRVPRLLLSSADAAQGEGSKAPTGPARWDPGRHSAATPYSRDPGLWQGGAAPAHPPIREIPSTRDAQTQVRQRRRPDQDAQTQVFFIPEHVSPEGAPQPLLTGQDGAQPQLQARQGSHPKQDAQTQVSFFLEDRSSGRAAQQPLAVDPGGNAGATPAAAAGETPASALATDTYAAPATAAGQAQARCPDQAAGSQALRATGPEVAAGEKPSQEQAAEAPPNREAAGWRDGAGLPRFCPYCGLPLIREVIERMGGQWQELSHAQQRKQSLNPQHDCRDHQQMRISCGGCSTSSGSTESLHARHPRQAYADMHGINPLQSSFKVRIAPLGMRQAKPATFPYELLCGYPFPLGVGRRQ